MSFELILTDRRESIKAHEELMLDSTIDTIKHPKLRWLLDNFYSSPKIDPSSANLLVHELIDLRSSSKDQTLKFTLDRLIPFFSKAYVSDLWISTSSD